MRAIFLLFSILFSSIFSQAQIFDPVSWTTETKVFEDGKVELLVHATIEKDWHLYSQTLPSDDGPIATEFTFPKSYFKST